MYCHHCDKQQPDDAIYCNQCGRRLKEPAAAGLRERGAEEAAAGAESAASEPLPAVRTADRALPAKRSKNRIVLGLVPFLVFVLTAVGVTAYYLYEADVNSRVQEWQAKAQQEALAGHYGEAMSWLERSISARPEYEAALADRLAVQEAMQTEEALTAIGELLEKGTLGEAKLRIRELRPKLNERGEPLFEPLRDKLEHAEVDLAVRQAEAGLGELKTVNELVQKYKELEALNGQEAVELQGKLKDRIAAAAHDEASALLAKKSFSDALGMARKGLDYAPGDEKLTALADRIESERKAYEEEEQQRIEHAMQVAAEEDLRNHTAAVEVLSFDKALDESGRLTITGHLKNAATRPIYSVHVQFTVSDPEGNVLKKSEVDASPDYIESGDEFTFEWTTDEVGRDDVNVVVDHATWFLD